MPATEVDCQDRKTPWQQDAEQGPVCESKNILKVLWKQKLKVAMI